MNQRENIIKSIHFDGPELIPMEFHINPACWNYYDRDMLLGLIQDHPILFPDFEPNEFQTNELLENQRSSEPYLDPWGCVWSTTEDGITGSVHEHPLANWSDFDGYTPPSPLETDGTYPIDWKQIELEMRRKKEMAELTKVGLPHGHTFLRMMDIRGYQNLIFDMIDSDPRLDALIAMVTDFNYELVCRFIDLEPDIICYPEDLGMQVGPMLSPADFRKYIEPVYRRLLKPAHDHGCMVHMHSDGDIRTLAKDLMDVKFDVLNLQDLVNGIDWIADNLAGRVCIDLDIDRQRVTASGTPQQIDGLIREEVEKLGSPKGGLMMIYGLYPGIPSENIAALMDAMEKYSTYYS